MMYKRGEEVYNGRYIDHDGQQIINPTEEMLLAAGFVKVEETEAEKLAKAKAKKLIEIEQYAQTSAVNEFDVNGIKTWFPPDLRSNYSTSLRANEFLNNEQIMFAIGGRAMTTSRHNARYMLAQIQVYADATYMVTQKHKAIVSQLQSVEQVENYDNTKGYPQKLVFTL